ncbi:MAG: hypothetical protein VW338_15990 [Rhodospirillaceae bacterium]
MTIYRTAGTRLEWHDLTSWVACAWILARRRSISHHPTATDRQFAGHWRSLPIDMVKRSDDDQALEELAAVAARFQVIPQRGHRAGSKWESINMARKNRLFQLERQRDRDAIGAGHNARSNAP